MISQDRLLPEDAAEWIPEDAFPFAVDDIVAALPSAWGKSAHKGNEEVTVIHNERRAGWYLQQLLKLYAHQVVSAIRLLWVSRTLQGFVVMHNPWLYHIPFNRRSQG